MRHALVTAVLLLTLAAASALGACAGEAPLPDGAADVHAAVTAYNQALARAFETLDMNELNTTATEDQAWREYYFLAALGEGRMMMLSTLKSLEFGEVTFPAEGEASVTTTEVWDYDHVSLDTSETVRTERGVRYDLRYDLVLVDGRWLVDDVTSLDESPASEEATP